jgi:stress response protein SCP2
VFTGRSVTHSGDEKTGVSAGADEVITVNVDSLAPQVSAVVITVSVRTPTGITTCPSANIVIRQGDATLESTVVSPQWSASSYIFGMLYR